MEQTFERVEKHLHRRSYQTTNGDWGTAYYGRFTDWKGKRTELAIKFLLLTVKGEK